MAKHILSIICVLTNIISLISFANSISSCTNNGPCQTLNDGDGQLIFFFSSSVESDNQLICINGKCNNDPNLGTHICEEPIPEDGLPCNGTCKTLDDCEGQLICINGKCDDDPDIGTNRCGGASSPPPPPDPSVCDGPCRTLDDCDGQLICINGKCDDDPDIGTHRCDGVSSPPPPIGSCLQHGEVKCQGNSYPTYNCSSQVTSSTLANLTLKNFESRTSGSSKCEERSHSNNETIVALSTGWYAGGIRCGKMIQINGINGRTVRAKVVDECDSMNTCEPCKNDIIDGSKAVWDALGLNTDVGEVSVTWSMG